MIQPISYERSQINETTNIKDSSKTPAPPALSGEGKNRILDIYTEDLAAISPTYGEDVKQLMKQENIEDNSLNAEIIKTMNKNQVPITKDAVNIIVNELQTEHLFQLYEQGYNIEELTVDIIAKEIRASGDIITATDGTEEDQGGTAIDADISYALIQAGLPLTNKNTVVLEQYRDQAEDVTSINKVTIPNMLRSKSEITVNNLYIAKHSGAPKQTTNYVTEDQISKVLEANKIEITEETIEVARQLIDSNIEVTKDNVQEFLKIQKSIQDMDVSKLVQQAAKEMKKGHKPGDITIGNPVSVETGSLNYDEIKQIVEDIKHIDHEIIKITYRNNKPITIENLQQVLHENVAKVLQESPKGVDSSKVIEDPKSVEGSEVSAEGVGREGEVDGQAGDTGVTSDQLKSETTARRQIEEIRLKLTLEAALKLNNKLDIKTADLQKVVEELKVIERQMSKDILENMKTPVTEENIETMGKVKEHIYNISQNKEIATVQVVEGETDFTLEAMDEAIQAVKTKHAHNVYEETWTRPERRFGEGISKVENQLEHILEMQEIEATTPNVKAAKALVQNNIEVTPESIESAKTVLLKIETVLYELRPAVVAQMLKDGMRPDTMEIDQLIQQIQVLKKDSNLDSTQKLAESILELDQTNQVTPAEREGLIAVYRMLNTITKNETAAIGFLLDNNKEPTLGNLFEASKYIKQVGSKTGKMDRLIDDQTGTREGELPANIRSLIEKAVQPVMGEQINQSSNKAIIDQWLSRITPQELKKYIDLDKSLDELELNHGKTSHIEMARTIKQAQGLEKVSPQTLALLEEQNIPLTIPNVYWADKIMKTPFLLGDMLKEYETLTQEKIESSLNGANKDHKNSDNKQDLESTIEHLQKELKDQLPQWLSASQSSKAYSLGQELDQMISVQKQISSTEGIYQIPVELHNGISNLNVYVMKDKEQSNKAEKNELRAYMSINTENLGMIQVHMQVSDKSMAFEMMGETPEITLKLKKDASQLRAAIENIGYNVLGAKFSQGEPKKPIIDKKAISSSLLKNRFSESKFEHII